MADADPGAGGAGNTPPNLDQIRSEAAQAANAAFGARLKELTGVDSLDALGAKLKADADAKLAADGEFKKLAETATARADALLHRLHGSLVGQALHAAAAAAGAVEPDVVHQLLASQAKVGDDDAVTVGGKSPADAVKDLLAAKPFLARPASGSGSGAGAGGGGGKTLTRAAFQAMPPAERQKHLADGGKITD